MLVGRRTFHGYRPPKKRVLPSLQRPLPEGNCHRRGVLMPFCHVSPFRVHQNILIYKYNLSPERGLKAELEPI